MKVLSIIATGIIASAIVTTSAQAMGRKDDDTFNRFIIKMADTNADGKVSKDEFMKMSAKMAAKEFMVMDMDDDGHISAEEFSMHNR